MATRAQARGYRFELVGLEDLIRNLEELPTISMQKTVLRNALKKAGKPIADLARENAPYDPNPHDGKHLRETIEVSTKLKASQKKGRISDRTAVTVYVGSSAPHAHLVEFGTIERVLKKPRVVNLKGKMVTIKSTGRVKPNPFMRDAWDQMKMTALKIFGEEMRNEIYKAARRLAKRAEKGKLTKAMIRGLNK